MKDIDLGFTSASNTNAIRRLDLVQGEQSESVVVWLDTEGWTVKPFCQSYKRIQRKAFEYVSSQHDYKATLAVDEFGAVSDYQGLWVISSSRSRSITGCSQFVGAIQLSSFEVMPMAQWL
ncbi:putative glycolipid-binding domain-containing protein [Paracoccus sp. (in: a-proteobacteria)]|uniref:putative glycolipid-binding domain-containing protein n=1 Tax=Paracoccus sp. TaxID=267 RepID=UPI0028B11E0D|nr:putative glycolipid-binding domain-containing protein [Paracoccus sp. (in: a-proteobacteria)]